PPQVHAEQTVRREVDEVAEVTHVAVAAVGREAHDLALVGVRMEPEVPGDRCVDLAQRVGIADLGERADLGASAVPEGGGEPVAAPIEREYRSVVEPARVKGARRVSLVVPYVHGSPAIPPAAHERLLLSNQVEVDQGLCGGV